MYKKMSVQQGVYLNEVNVMDTIMNRMKRKNQDSGIGSYAPVRIESINDAVNPIMAQGERLSRVADPNTVYVGINQPHKHRSRSKKRDGSRRKHRTVGLILDPGNYRPQETPKSNNSQGGSEFSQSDSKESSSHSQTVVIEPPEMSQIQKYEIEMLMEMRNRLVTNVAQKELKILEKHEQMTKLQSEIVFCEKERIRLTDENLQLMHENSTLQEIEHERVKQIEKDYEESQRVHDEALKPLIDEHMQDENEFNISMNAQKSKYEQELNAVHDELEKCEAEIHGSEREIESMKEKLFSLKDGMKNIIMEKVKAAALDERIKQDQEEARLHLAIVEEENKLEKFMRGEEELTVVLGTMRKKFGESKQLAERAVEKLRSGKAKYRDELENVQVEANRLTIIYEKLKDAQTAALEDLERMRGLEEEMRRGDEMYKQDEEGDRDTSNRFYHQLRNISSILNDEVKDMQRICEKLEARDREVQDLTIAYKQKNEHLRNAFQQIAARISSTLSV